MGVAHGIRGPYVHVAGRRAGLTEDVGSPMMLARSGYLADANRNRTNSMIGEATTSYVVVAADQLMEPRDGWTIALPQSFGHDGNGNRSSSTVGGTTVTHAYDWRNRMTSAQASDSTVTYT